MMRLRKLAMAGPMKALQLDDERTLGNAPPRLRSRHDRTATMPEALFM